ncbi:MAG: cystathionine gamma-synthase family protein [Thermomicrobiales bacterium]|nr:cystathionine gamma-synthase family protein [Thermomicrobiales bacterium]
MEKRESDAQTSIDGHALRPESLMMSYGYRPEWSEGSLKPPIFQTSTFVFKSAEDGKAFFEVAYGLREPTAGEESGLIYSRINNPDLEIVEDRLAIWDEAESCAVFASGMAAITTTMLAYLRPGDTLVHSEPLYGGTDHFIRHVLADFGIKAAGFKAGEGPEALEEAVAGLAPGSVGMIYVETPANPTNALVDIAHCAAIARSLSTAERHVPVAVDNTFLGPVWSQPLKHGADLVIYSATKYIGGHSDLIAGACLGSKTVMAPVRALRTFFGSMLSPFHGWLMLRSLETLKIRMVQQTENAKLIAEFLRDHPAVEKVYYLGHIDESDPQYDVYQRQCLAPGAMVSFDVRGGEAEAFAFLNALKICHLAVSLGGTESLAEHPSTMTHSDVPKAEKERMGLTDKMVRLSIGLEDPQDLMRDFDQALAAAMKTQTLAVGD